MEAAPHPVLIGRDNVATVSGRATNGPSLRTAFAVLLFVQILDVLTTHAVLSRQGVEGSPLSRLLLSTGGFAGLTAGKAAFYTLSVLAGTALVRRGFAAVASRALFVVNGIYVVAVGWNAWQVFTFAR